MSNFGFLWTDQPWPTRLGNRGRPLLIGVKERRPSAEPCRTARSTALMMCLWLFWKNAAALCPSIALTLKWTAGLTRRCAFPPAATDVAARSQRGRSRRRDMKLRNSSAMPPREGMTISPWWTAAIMSRGKYHAPVSNAAPAARTVACAACGGSGCEGTRAAARGSRTRRQTSSRRQWRSTDAALAACEAMPAAPLAVLDAVTAASPASADAVTAVFCAITWRRGEGVLDRPLDRVFGASSIIDFAMLENACLTVVVPLRTPLTCDDSDAGDLCRPCFHALRAVLGRLELGLLHLSASTWSRPPASWARIFWRSAGRRLSSASSCS